MSLLKRVMPIIVFSSTHHALAAEKALEEEMEIDIVPLPAKYQADCGLAIEFDPAEIDRVRKILSRNTLEYKDIYTPDDGC